MTSRMAVLEFAGGYEDDRGVESISWRINPPPESRRFEIHTMVRGVPLSGPDFDGLEPDEPDGAVAAGLSLNAFGELANCLLHGDLPCGITIDGRHRPIVMRFTLDLRVTQPIPDLRNLHLSTVIDDVTFAVTDSWFEDGLMRLEQSFPPGVRLHCCLTCLYSDYQPGGHGLMGMRCHRDAKARYLAVRSKADYWPVPVTEEVPETYLCPEYQLRVPGTGYRG